MFDIASQRGLTPAQLEDRVVPDLGLDDKGGRVFDYGPRQFRLVLGRDLKPVLLDGKGKARADLPRPAAGDDPDRAGRARAEWKLLRKQLRDILRAQAVRLEAALIEGWLWAVGEFETWIVRHAVVGLLAQRLLWAGRDEDGRLVKVFRVTEDRGYALADESPCGLGGVARVGLLHPLHLSDEDRRAWQRVLAGHGVVPPFPQLGRKVYTLRPGEKKLTFLRRHEGVRVEALTLLGTLERLGWERAGPRHGESPYTFGAAPVVAHLKHFPSAGVTAVIRHDPGVPPAGFPAAVEPQTLEGCVFVRGRTEPTGGFRPEHAVPLGRVDPVVVSEVLGVLELLAGKALV